MIRIDQLKLKIDDENKLEQAISQRLKVSVDKIKEFFVLKKSIDARKKPDIYFVYSIIVKLSASDENKALSKAKRDNNINKYIPNSYSLPKLSRSTDLPRPVIIGAGPAGLFAAYLLSLKGLNPIILERGRDVDSRTEDIIRFWQTGILDISSNVQFGEGGAGTFSDGKLNTLVNDKEGRNRFVLETFVKYGVPSNILYDYKPHIGTDILKDVIKNIRQEIIELGGEFYFNARVDDFIIENNTLIAVKANDKLFKSDSFVLAIGHSARDTFEILNHSGVHMEAKDFAVGLRIEHPQKMISQVMYDEAYSKLEPAPYKLATRLSNGRGVYSFCMCPGGFVVNSSSENERMVVNGMSYSRRDSKNANSAIVVSVGADEFDKSNPLAGVEYQRIIENKAFNLCNGKIPQQLFGDFKQGKLSSSFGDFSSETKGHRDFGLLSDIFSQEINKAFIDGMSLFGTKIKGFDRYDAILSGVESRTSSPVRINRNEAFQANISGLYPCGEGAGYAGGITSAAMDGMKVAEAIIAKHNL